jgi:hypothetical protein
LVTDLSAENVKDVIEKHPLPYSYLRVQVKPIPEDAKAVIASYTPLDTVIWYHEELTTPEVDKIIDKRLDNEKVNFGKNPKITTF